ncbi:MAG TPA: hypothetical protein VHK90_09525, partial [Thermoanaerobaculia bacterium]|nr:hypothetical protein [Thermoanaerobaculia bacterium]
TRGMRSSEPRVTCEVRHFEGGSSVILAAPEGSERFRNAKLQIWRKHAALIDNDVIANVFERQKRRASALYSEAVEAKGRAEAAETEIARAMRESVDRENELNGYRLRVRELEGSLAALQALVPLLDEKSMTIEHLRHDVARVEEENAQLRASNTRASEDIARLHVEIERLNGLLDMIYRSRTWKLHTLAQKLRGRV